MDAATIWRQKTDDELLAAGATLSDYMPEGQEIIRAELARRGISLEAPRVDAVADAPQPVVASHRNPIAKLWHGEYSLPMTYWVWGWLGNLALNMIEFTVFEFAASSHAVLPLVVLFFCVRLLYLSVVFVGVWRSAGRYTGPSAWATLARVAVAASVAIMVVRMVVALI